VLFILSDIEYTDILQLFFAGAYDECSAQLGMRSVAAATNVRACDVANTHLCTLMTSRHAHTSASIRPNDHDEQMLIQNNVRARVRFAFVSHI
jgi:hypothetical protein